MTPSVDKWLTIQQKVVSALDMVKQSKAMLGHAQDNLNNLTDVLNPDHSSNVRTVFSEGEQILACIDNDGVLLTHEGAHALHKISQQADKLNLIGEEKIAYIQKHGQAELSHRYADLQVTLYNGAEMPSRREFAEAWYPHHDVEAAYERALKTYKAILAQREVDHARHLQNLNDMRATLLQIMEQAQNEQEAA